MKMLILGDVVPTFVTDPLFKNKDVETLSVTLCRFSRVTM